MEVSNEFQLKLDHPPRSKVSFLGLVTFGNATVTLADVTAWNGVVHAIDEVLFDTLPQEPISQNPKKRYSKNPSKNLVCYFNFSSIDVDKGFRDFRLT